MEKKVYIRSMAKEDIMKMTKWSRHENPLLFHYNFPCLNERECSKWFYDRTRKMGRRNYVIENEDRQIVGYLSIRNIKIFSKSSELGIVLDPGEINKKYGRYAIKEFMEYYFNNMNMKKLKLRVAEYNTRGYKCYKSCGFKVTGERYELFEDQDSVIFTNDKYIDYRKYFTYKKDRKLIKYIHMEISKDFYEQMKNNTKNQEELCH